MDPTKNKKVYLPPRIEVIDATVYDGIAQSNTRQFDDFEGYEF